MGECRAMPYRAEVTRLPQRSGEFSTARSGEITSATDRVLMVTSAANRGWPGDVAVSDLAAAVLPAASVVRSAKIAMIEARDTERIGHLPPEDRSRVAEAVRGSLAQLLGD